MEFKSHQPIYLQIYYHICEMILNGKYKSGDKIMSVREMAIEVGVNPNTVMRSYELLQNKNIIVSIRGIGFSINENAKEIILEEQKKHFIEEELPDIVKKLKMYGISIEEIERQLKVES
ncbi:MAG: GntR family transcriptional regulator [Bacteroidales bacterium]|nr:GntR family transcriptional regulator [Bacteroidales bacterium]